MRTMSCSVVDKTILPRMQNGRSIEPRDIYGEIGLRGAWMSLTGAALMYQVSSKEEPVKSIPHLR